VFLGLSAGGVLKAPMVASMAARPLIFALANPTPEIMPEEVKAVRDDAIMATGRTDYPNQVNNVLCFPYIFRGALDSAPPPSPTRWRSPRCTPSPSWRRPSRTTWWPRPMPAATLSFGPEYLIPKPFDPRLMMKIAPAVARAAAASGVAARPVTDFDAYREKLRASSTPRADAMKPIFARPSAPSAATWPLPRAKTDACCAPCRWWWTKAWRGPGWWGARSIIEQRIDKLGLRLQPGRDFDIVNIDDDPRYRDYWQTYHR
jgi:malate dehydrogenase (oxaloacetate-decarboxylating)(NADP+)